MKKMLLLIFVFSLLFATDIYAEEYVSIDDFDLSESQQLLQEHTYQMDIDSLLKKIMNGEIFSALNEVIDGMRWNIKKEVYDVKSVLVSILFTAILAALITNFTYAVSKSEIRDMGFYVCYVLQISILLYAFQIVCGIAKGMVSLILELIYAILPAYMLSVGLFGQIAASGFHGFILMLIAGIEIVILKIIFPLLKIYIVICLVNNISKEDLLSKAAELLKRFILFAYKTILGLVTGINVIQALILPVADNAKNYMFKKALASIPIVGSGTGTMAEIVLNSVNIIKNSIGVLAIILIAMICILPSIKVLIYSGVMQISAVILQPISDGRIVKSITCTYEGIRLVNQAMYLVAFLFILTITIVCISTGNVG